LQPSHSFLIFSNLNNEKEKKKMVILIIKRKVFNKEQFPAPPSPIPPPPPSLEIMGDYSKDYQPLPNPTLNWVDMHPAARQNTQHIECKIAHMLIFQNDSFKRLEKFKKYTSKF
jgi:hypothetical protein